MDVQNRLRDLSGMGITHDTRRDTWSIFGWPKTLNYDNFLGMYRRGLGGRIVDLPAVDTWKHPPQLSEDGETQTQFVTQTEEIFHRLNVWARMMQADKLAGIGQFSIILLGFRDLARNDNGDPVDTLPANLTEPVNKESLSGPEDLTYFRVYSQNDVSSIALDGNPNSPRFGLPELYQINIQPLNESDTAITNSVGASTITVHWTRVLHIVRNPVDNDILGSPTLERPYNSLLAFYQTIGAGAEAFWQVVWRGLAFSTQEGYKFQPGDKEALEQEIGEYQHQYRRFMRLQGVDVTDLGTDDVDPSGMLDGIMMALAGETGIALRILFGSERGQLASEQDERGWAGTITSRQTNFAEPVVRGFVDRLIDFGLVSAPSGQYHFGTKQPDGSWQWPAIFEHSEKETAEISQTRATALKTAQEAKLLGAVIQDTEVREYGGVTAVPDVEDVALTEPTVPDDQI